jgi:hypothetical protein
MWNIICSGLIKGEIPFSRRSEKRFVVFGDILFELLLTFDPPLILLETINTFLPMPPIGDQLEVSCITITH